MKILLRKLTSVKTLALIFCCGLLLYIVVSHKTEFIDIARTLSYAPLSYFVVNVAQDFVHKKLNRSADETTSDSEVK